MFDRIKNKIPGTHIEQDKYGKRIPKMATSTKKSLVRARRTSIREK